MLEKGAKKDNYLIPEDFPIGSCTVSSTLLSYHFLKSWPNLELKGVRAATGKNHQISHYWLEIDDIVIDITGDQYNKMDDKCLNKNIIQNRPFPPIHISCKKESYLYNLFKVTGEESLTHDFSMFGNDYIEDISIAYRQLLNY